MTLAAGTRLGGYEILTPLGAGGMGEVYRARDTKLNRDVAIKILPAALAADPDAQARFQREAQAVAALSHPNILGIFDFGVDGGTPYAVTELLEGSTLRERLAEGAIPPRKAIEYTVQIATGLAAAHERGITHRDLKPENVFVTRDGRVKILDFGLAKVGAGPTPAAGASMEATFHVTSPGTVLGTVGYMSPEQVRGRAVDHRSDIFSLGAVLFEMLAGTRAFTGESAVETLNAILKEDPPELTRAHATLPPAIDRIVRRCLEKNPDERFQSARDLAFALDAIAGSSTKVDVAEVTAGPRRPLRLALVGGAGVALVALAFAAGWFARSARPSSAVGETAQPTFHRLTFRRGWISGARFAPDGQTVVYSAQWEGGPPEIYLTGLGSPESRALGPRGLLEGVSRGGELAVLIKTRILFSQYQQIGVLAQVPLTGGAPREIQESARYADWAPDGRELAIVRQVGRKWRLEYPIAHTVYESSSDLLNPRVSPGGDLIAFFEGTDFGDWSVSVIDREGKKRVSSSGYSDWWFLAWKPDGQEVWFGASETGRSNPLYAIDLTGRRRMLLRVPGSIELHDISRDGRLLVTRMTQTQTMIGRAAGQSQEADLTWHDYSGVSDISDDGSTLVFSSTGDAGGKRGIVYLRKMDGSPAVPLGEGQFSALSPDGKSVASVGVPKDVFLLPTGPGQPRKLSFGRFESTKRVTWFPDGRLLIAAREPGHNVRLHVQATADADARAITPEGFDVAGSGGKPVSPDGKRIAAIDPDGRVFLVGVDGAAPQLAVGVAAGELPVAWTSDSRSVYVFRRGELPAKVFRVDIATGRRVLWKELMPSDTAGVVGLLTVVIPPDGRSYAYSFGRYLSDLYVVEGVK